MFIKTVFKSHFKVKKSFKKNLKKKIFIKNTLIFLMFVKIFFKNCSVSFFFTKNRSIYTNILKAPSRHKKFFHQVVYEFFTTKVNFFFKSFFLKYVLLSIPTFNIINNVFYKIGSNTLTRVKFTAIFKSPLLLVVPVY